METVVESKSTLKTPAYAAKSAKSALSPLSIDWENAHPLAAIPPA